MPIKRFTLPTKWENGRWANPVNNHRALLPAFYNIYPDGFGGFRDEVPRLKPGATGWFVPFGTCGKQAYKSISQINESPLFATPGPEFFRGGVLFDVERGRG